MLQESPEFHTALEQNIVTAEMQWDTQPRLGLKLSKILNAQEIKRYQVMSEGVDSYLLPNGYRELNLRLSCSDSLII